MLLITEQYLASEGHGVSAQVLMTGALPVTRWCGEDKHWGDAYTFGTCQVSRPSPGSTASWGPGGSVRSFFTIQLLLLFLWQEVAMSSKEEKAHLLWDHYRRLTTWAVCGVSLSSHVPPAQAQLLGNKLHITGGVWQSGVGLGVWKHR